MDVERQLPVADAEARSHFRSLAQLRKARKLADTLILFGGDAEIAHDLSPVARRLAERVAGVTSPSSPTTWAMVEELLS